MTDFAARRERQQREVVQQAVAAVGGGLSVPVAEVGPDGRPSERRKPFTLDMLGRHPSVWVAWLWDAMLRSGRGMRKPTQRRNGVGARRPDKPAYGERRYNLAPRHPG